MKSMVFKLFDKFSLFKPTNIRDLKGIMPLFRVNILSNIMIFRVNILSNNMIFRVNTLSNIMIFRVNILSNIMIFKSHSLFLKFNYVNYIILLHKHAKAKTRRVSCFSDPTVSA